MIGVIINALAIAILAVLGKFIGNRIPTRVQEQVFMVIPLSVMTMGIQMALKADEFIIVMNVPCHRHGHRRSRGYRRRI